MIYHIIHTVVAVGFFLIVIISLGTIKIGEIKWEKELDILCQDIATLQGVNIQETYIPAEKDYLYGFLDSKGQEKISCQYDRVSYFNELTINNVTYFVAFAKKDNKIYLISKSNDAIEIVGGLKEIAELVMKELEENSLKKNNEDGYYRSSYLQSFNFVFQVIMLREDIKMESQTIRGGFETTNEIMLTERDSKYYGKNQNYSITIEPLDNPVAEEDEYFDYFTDLDRHTAKITTTKANGEQETSILYLAEFSESESVIGTFSDGYIGFTDDKNNQCGWFDKDGNKLTISGEYDIEDIRDGKAILATNNMEERNYIIINLAGNILLQTRAFYMFEDMYLAKKGDRAMVLLDKDLKEISKEYDKIIPEPAIDLTPYYAAYD